MSERIVPVLRKLSRDVGRGRYARAAIFRGPIEREPTPFRTVVGCLLSQRARDDQTGPITEALFEVADTPEAILALPLSRLHRIIHGSGFYRQKAKMMRALCREVLRRGGVPRDREALMELPGIGPKCAAIVTARCFGAPHIAVDTHVHRISNRLGWVRTKTPEKTEAALTPLVPVRWRRKVNVLLVAHGQVICKPIRPLCEDCSVSRECRRRGVSSRSSG